MKQNKREEGSDMKKHGDLPRTSRVNEKIIEYYTKFGKDRDLEKFMRLYSPASSRSNKSKTTTLTTATTTSGSNTSVNSSQSNNSSSCCANAYSDIEANVLKRLFKEKNYHRHRPPAHHQHHQYRGEILTSASSLPNMDICLEKLKISQNEKYSAEKENIVTIPISKEKQAEQKTTNEKDLKTPEKLDDLGLPIKTPESVAKIHKRLEWDSLADVGYLKSKSTSNISTIERSLLRELFQDFNSQVMPKTNASESDLKRLELEQNLGSFSRHLDYNTPPLASSTFMNPNSRSQERQRLLGRTIKNIFKAQEKENLILEESEKLEKNDWSSHQKRRETIPEVPHDKPNVLEKEKEIKSVPGKEQDDKLKHITVACEVPKTDDNIEWKDCLTQTEPCHKKINRKVQVNFSSSSSVVGSSVTPSSFDPYMSKTSTTTDSPLPELNLSPDEQHPFMLCLSKMLSERRETADQKKKHSSKKPNKEEDMNEIDSLQKIHDTFREALEKTYQDTEKMSSKSKNCLQNTTLELGIQLLCKLVDDTRLDKNAKHKLIRDIVKRILFLSGEKMDVLLDTASTKGYSAKKTSNPCQQVEEISQVIIDSFEKSQQDRRADKKSCSSKAAAKAFPESTNSYSSKENVYEEIHFADSSQHSKTTSFPKPKSLPKPDMQSSLPPPVPAENINDNLDKCSQKSKNSQRVHGEEEKTGPKQEISKKSVETQVTLSGKSSRRQQKPQFKLPPFKIVPNLKRSSTDNKERQEISDFSSSVYTSRDATRNSTTTTTSTTTTSSSISEEAIATQRNLKASKKNDSETMQRLLSPMTQSEIEYEKRKKDKKKLQDEKNVLKPSKPPASGPETTKRPLTINIPADGIHIYDSVLDSLKEISKSTEHLYQTQEIKVIIEDQSSGFDAIQHEKEFMDAVADGRCVIYDVPNKEVIYDSAVDKIDCRKTCPIHTKSEKQSKAKKADTEIPPVKPPRKKSVDIIELSAGRKHQSDQQNPEKSEIPIKPRSKMDTPSDTQGTESVDSFIAQRRNEFLARYKAKQRAHKEALKLQKIQQEQVLLEQKEKLFEQKLKQLTSPHCYMACSMPQTCSQNVPSCNFHMQRFHHHCPAFYPLPCQCPSFVHLGNTNQSFPPPPPPPPTTISDDYLQQKKKQTKTKTQSQTAQHQAPVTSSKGEQKLFELTSSTTTTSATTPNTSSSSHSKYNKQKHKTSPKAKDSTTISSFSATSEISVPMGTSNQTSQTPTTTHQYDDIQNNIRSKSFNSSEASRRRHTKTCAIQVKPKGIAYIIQFDKTSNALKKKSSSSQNFYQNQIQTKASNLPSHPREVAESESLAGEVAAEKEKMKLSMRTTSTSQEDSQKAKLHSVSYLTLQEHLQLCRPDFVQHSKQRKALLNKLQSQRQERERELRTIIENSSFRSLERKLSKLPAPPHCENRIFRTKQMRAMSRRKFSNLPEVVAKKQREKDEQKKRSNRILRDIFNKRLQRHVHKGKTSLNNSEIVV